MKEIKIFSTNYRAIVENEFREVEWAKEVKTANSATKKFTGFKDDQKYRGQMRLSFHGADVVLSLEYEEVRSRKRKRK